MSARGAARSCTTVTGCVSTAVYEVRASGGFVGTQRKPPKAVHVLSCEGHLKTAQKMIADREVRSIQLMSDIQTSLFDGLG